MYIDNTGKLITFVVFLLSGVSIVFFVLANHQLEHQHIAFKALDDSVKAAHLLIQGSDTLAYAVRSRAATDDKRYLHDFQIELNVTRFRERAIGRLRELKATSGEMDFVEKAKHNSDVLVIEVNHV
jgi:hypothetical protein